MDQKLRTAEAVQYAGSLVGFVMAFIQTYAAAIGILIAIAGYVTSLYYQRKKDRREEREHRARMQIGDDIE